MYSRIETYCFLSNVTGEPKSAMSLTTTGFDLSAIVLATVTDAPSWADSRTDRTEPNEATSLTDRQL